MFPDFPMLGSGFDTFGSAYRRYQTFDTFDWFLEAHNEYLHVLLETGAVGALIMPALLWVLLRGALRASLETPLDAGILGALLGLCAHNVVDFNWQIPANAATFAALAGVVVRRSIEVRVRAGPVHRPGGERDPEHPGRVLRLARGQGHAAKGAVRDRIERIDGHGPGERGLEQRRISLRIDERGQRSG